MKRLVSIRDKSGKRIGSIMLNLPEGCEMINLGQLGLFRVTKIASFLPLASAVEMPADSRQARGLKPMAIGDMAVVGSLFFYKNRFIGPVKGLAVNYDTVAATPLPFMSQDSIEAMLKAHREAEVTVNEKGDVKVEMR